jgi:hypothetical protein
MTLRKRGLGRGLEALLADDPAKNEQNLQTRQTEDGRDAEGFAKLEAAGGKVEDRSALVVALFKNIQRENLILLEEAESLRQLIAEFESLIRADF